MKEKSWPDNNRIYWFFLTFGYFWRSKSLIVNRKIWSLKPTKILATRMIQSDWDSVLRNLKKWRWQFLFSWHRFGDRDKQRKEPQWHLPIAFLFWFTEEKCTNFTRAKQNVNGAVIKTLVGLGDKGDYTIHFYRDYHRPLIRIPMKWTSITKWKRPMFFFFPPIFFSPLGLTSCDSGAWVKHWSMKFMTRGWWKRKPLEGLNF